LLEEIKPINSTITIDIYSVVFMFVIFALALLRSMPRPNLVVALMPYCFNNKPKQDFRLRRPHTENRETGNLPAQNNGQIFSRIFFTILEGCI